MSSTEEIMGGVDNIKAQLTAGDEALQDAVLRRIALQEVGMRIGTMLGDVARLLDDRFADDAGGLQHTVGEAHRSYSDATAGIMALANDSANPNVLEARSWAISARGQTDRYNGGGHAKLIVETREEANTHLLALQKAVEHMVALTGNIEGELDAAPVESGEAAAALDRYIQDIS